LPNRALDNECLSVYHGLRDNPVTDQKIIDSFLLQPWIYWAFKSRALQTGWWAHTSPPEEQWASNSYPPLLLYLLKFNTQISLAVVLHVVTA